MIFDSGRGGRRECGIQRSVYIGASATTTPMFGQLGFGNWSDDGVPETKGGIPVWLTKSRDRRAFLIRLKFRLILEFLGGFQVSR